MSAAPRALGPRAIVAVAAVVALGGCATDERSGQGVPYAPPPPKSVPAPPTTAPVVPGPRPASGAHPATTASTPPPPTAPSPAPPAQAPAHVPPQPLLTRLSAARRPRAHHDVRPARRAPAVSAPGAPAEPAAGRDPKVDEANARASVVSFHELLDRHDPAACDLFTAAFLRAGFGDDPQVAMERCRSMVRAISEPVTVVVLGGSARGSTAVVEVISRMGSDEQRQTFHLVRIKPQGSRPEAWLIDAIAGQPRS